MEPEDSLRDANLDLCKKLAEYLGELNLQAKATREQQQAEFARKANISSWGQFWGWLRDNSTGLTVFIAALSAIIGGAWAVSQYRGAEREKKDQKQQEIQLQRNLIIAQYASQLSDPRTRNSAAYALAAVAREDALPQLVSLLKETTGSDDASFRKAIAQALILIGDPAVNAAIQLNRETRARAEYITDLNNEELAIIATTQIVIDYMLKQIATRPSRTFKDFSRIVLTKIRLEHLAFEDLNFRNIIIEEGNLCQVTLRRVNMENAILNNVQLGESHLEQVKLNGAHLFDTNLTAAILDGAEARAARFPRQMQMASLVGARLSSSDFSDVSLAFAIFENADLSKVDFSGATLFRANLQMTNLSGARLYKTDLENADLSGADLGGALFFQKDGDRPGFSDELKDAVDFPSPGAGAIVRNATFTNAKNISKEQREYLCKWGAVNVPGGCDGISKMEFPEAILRRGGGFGCAGGGF